MVVAGPRRDARQGRCSAPAGRALQLVRFVQLSRRTSITLYSDAASLSVLGLGYNGVPTISHDSTGVIAIETGKFDAISDLAKIGDGTAPSGHLSTAATSPENPSPPARETSIVSVAAAAADSATARPLIIQQPVLVGSAGVEVGSTAWWGNGNVVLDGANTFTGPLIVQSPAPPGEYEISFVTSSDRDRPATAGASPFGSAQGPVLHR